VATDGPPSRMEFLNHHRAMGAIEERAKRYRKMQMELDSWRHWQYEEDREAWCLQLDKEG
jgi:hypothetical protein